MQYKAFGDTYFVRLERGEEILASLARFCREENIRLGHLTGLGAVDHLVAGLYSVEEKQYRKNEWSGEFEIASLTGNITRMDGEVYLHLHIAASGPDGAVLGGHLNEATISATAEIIVTKVNGDVGRKFDEGIGLNFLDF